VSGKRASVVAVTSLEPPQERAFDYARTVALSDGVFAIALTLLVLTISTPALESGHHGLLGRRLLDHSNELTSYAISFAVIALLWVRHHGFFRVLDRIDGRITVLNLTYLALVAFIPYPTRLLGMYGDEPAAVVLYASTLALIGLAAGLMRLHGTHNGLVSPAGRAELDERGHWAVVPTVFLLSIPIAFVSTTAAEISWFLVAIPRTRRRLR
jgi:uncharacterized membrane protein